MPKPSTLRARVLLGLTLAAAVAALVWGLLPKPLQVEIGGVARRDLRVTIAEDGQTRVTDRYVVSAPLLANLARVELSPGDSVTTDTVIARLLPLAPPLLDAQARAQARARVAATSASERQAHATIARAHTAVELAEREAVRLRALAKSGVAATRTLDHAELELRSQAEALASAEFAAKVADHEFSLARAALGLLGRDAARETDPLEIRSPIAGRVLRIFTQSEGVVQPGTPLLELGDPGSLEIVLDVLTTDAVQIAPGTRAMVSRFGGDGTLDAHVRMVEPSATTKVSALGVEEQRVNVVLDLDSPRALWAALGDGYRVEAALVIFDGRGLLTAPLSAVFRRGDDAAVFRVDAGRARLATVRTGKSNDDLVEITSGLEAGARVILHPSDRVEDGAHVAPD